MINADELKYDKIFYSLKNGDFYASTGPEFREISIENGLVTVECSPVAFVGLSTESRHLFAKKTEGKMLTKVEFDIAWHLDMEKGGPLEHQYIRVTLMDEYGNTAYSRAYFLDEII
jgi:hypothetical protein